MLREDNWSPEAALTRGRLVHRATEIIDKEEGGGLDWPSLHPVLVPYCEAYLSFRQVFGFVPKTIEEPVVNHKYRYRGTPDRVTDNILLDIKTGAVHPVEGPQTAAYAECFRRKLRRLTVHLMPNGKFTVQEWKDRADFPTFLACLQLFQWRIKHGFFTESRD